MHCSKMLKRHGQISPHSVASQFGISPMDNGLSFSISPLPLLVSLLVFWLVHQLLEGRGESVMYPPGAPGWLSQLSIKLWLRSWSCSSWVWAPCQVLCWRLRAWSLLQWVRASCQALCWQFGAWCLLQITCLPLSLHIPCSFSLSLSLSQINKH